MDRLYLNCLRFPSGEIYREIITPLGDHSIPLRGDGMEKECLFPIVSHIPRSMKHTLAYKGLRELSQKELELVANQKVKRGSDVSIK